MHTEEYNDRIKIPLPIYDLYPLERDTSNPDGAIVIPLFQAYANCYPYYHVNSAFWAMHSILLHANVIEKKIPIIFAVDESIWEWAEPLFNQAHIPTDDILFFNPPESKIKYYYLGLKLMPLLDVGFRSFYKHILIWDADMFVVSKNYKQLDIESMLRDGSPTSIGAIHIGDEVNKGYRVKETHGITDPTEAHELSKLLSFELTGKEIPKVFSVGGCLYRVSPQTQSQEFYDYLSKAIPLIGDDEIITSLWSLASGEKMEALDRFYPPIVYEMRHYDWHRENTDAFLAHIWTDSLRDETDQHIVKSDAGVYARRLSKSETHTGVPISFPYDPEVTCPIYPKVVALNLARRKDRRLSFSLHLNEHGYDGHIRFWQAIDRQAYGSRRELIQDAIDTDYPAFKALLDLPDETSHWDAYLWSYLRCLREIASQEDYVLLFEDDMGISMVWDEFIAYINQLPTDLNFALLNYNHDLNMQHNLEPYCQGFEVGCKSNGTSAVLYSPQGAELLHKTILIDCATTPEMHIHANDFPNTYSANPVCIVSLPEAGDSDLTPHHHTEKQPSQHT